MPLTHGRLSEPLRPTPTRLHVCTYVHAHARTHKSTHTHVQTRARARTPTRTRTHTNTHAYTHTHRHTHMHACTLARNPPKYIPMPPLCVLVLNMKTPSECTPPSGTTRVPLPYIFCMSHSYVRCDAFVRGACLHHIWDRIQSYVGHDLSYAKRDSFIYGIWHCETWDVNHSHVRHDSAASRTWLIHTWDRRFHLWITLHSYAGNGPFICGTWRILWRHLTLGCPTTPPRYSTTSRDSFVTLKGVPKPLFSLDLCDSPLSVLWPHLFLKCPVTSSRNGVAWLLLQSHHDEKCDV